MKIKCSVLKIIVEDYEIMNLEGEFFSMMSNYKGKLGSDAIDQFKKDFPKLRELYETIQSKRVDCHE